MKKLKSLIGLLVIGILAVGLVGAYGCTSAAPSPTPIKEMLPTHTVAVPEETTVPPVIQVALTPIVAQPTTVTPVGPPPATTVTNNTTVKTVLTPAAQASLLTEIRAKAEQASPGIYSIDAVTAKLLADNTTAIILDARYKVDYDVLHLGGAISLPVSSVWKALIDPVTVIPDKDAIYIAYCAPGCPAGLELTQELAARGYHNLFVLIGGYLYWQQAGYPMVIKS